MTPTFSRGAGQRWLRVHPHALAQLRWSGKDVDVPFTVQLRDEDGNVLDAFALRRLPVHVIPAPDDVNSPVLRFVDPFGDTILNRAQAAALLGELQAAAVDDPDVESYRRLVEITGRCANGVHDYLWLIGD